MSSGKGQVAAWQGFTFRLRQRENLLLDEYKKSKVFSLFYGQYLSEQQKLPNGVS